VTAAAAAAAKPQPTNGIKTPKTLPPQTPEKKDELVALSNWWLEPKMVQTVLCAFSKNKMARNA